MKIAAHVLAYNVNRFLKYVIENIDPHVDRIYIAHSSRPWGYASNSREENINPTTIEDVKNAVGSSDKVQIVEGDWITEEDMRNHCLDLARNEGYDWLIIQDADEFYSDHSWAQIKKVLASEQNADLIVTTWFNFWKSSQFVLVNEDGGIKGTNAGFAVNCNTNIKFTRKRITNSSSKRVLDCPCFHYGYVMSDKQMKEKLTTWGHTNEFNPEKWYKYKWEYWNTATRNLHPTSPENWSKVIRFPGEQPDFAHHFDLQVHTKRYTSIFDVLGSAIFNFHLKVKFYFKLSKMTLKLFKLPR